MEHLQEQQDSLMEKNDISFAEEEQNIINNNIDQVPTYYHEEDVQEHDQAIWDDLQDEMLNEISQDKLDPNSDELTVSVLNNDGTEKTFSIANPNEDSGIKTEKDIIELREYLEKEKDNIKEVTAKDKHKDNKLSLFDFVKKELNTNEYNSNGERLGEKIIMSLLKPFKIFNNYCNQLEQKQPPKIAPEKKEELFVKVDDQIYKLLSYSKDFKELHLESKEGQPYKIDNDKSLSFATEPKMDFTSLQMDLLLKGKTIIENNKENLPFKISWKDNAIQFETISTTDFEKNLKSKSLSETQKTSKKSNLSL